MYITNHNAKCIRQKTFPALVEAWQAIGVIGVIALTAVPTDAAKATEATETIKKASLADGNVGIDVNLLSELYIQSKRLQGETH